MLKTAKSRLTNARNALREAVAGAQPVLAPIVMPSTDETENMEYLKKERTEIEATRAKIQALKDCVNESMEKLHVAFEMLEDTKQEAELKSFDQYLQVAVENTNEADQFCANLIGKRAGVEQIIKDLRCAAFQSTRNGGRNNALEQSYHSTPTTPAIAPAMPPLQRCKAERRDTKSQIQLLEKITAMMSQLAINGQEVDQRLLLNIIFSKFDEDIQTRTLEKRADLENPKDWTWAKMQKELSGILQRREYVEQTRNKINAIQESSTKRPSQPIRGFKPTCIYCKRFGHQSTECRTIKESERLSFLKKNKLCLNCGKPFHTADVCRNPPCQKCGKMHHISLCMALSSQNQSQNPQESRQNATNFTQPVLQQRTRQPAQNVRRRRQRE
ncbi:zinc knuckle [Ostertagia ostertagi]